MARIKKTRQQKLADAKAVSVRRKVLRRDDFGLCVLLPKTAWAAFPPDGAAAVMVNGMPGSATVQTERCNCRGEGWHEHRFLSLPSKSTAQVGDSLDIEPVRK
jgi:hypothetical protein